jgi:tetratricopeptide (TPR) repeat protein
MSMSADNSPPDEIVVKLWNRYQEAVAKESFNEADDTIQAILDQAVEWCEDDDSADWALSLTACNCEENGDWLGAERAYREMLLLPDRDAMIEHTAHEKLAALYGNLNREAESLIESELQVAAARDTDSPVLLATSLLRHARKLLQAGRIADAETPVTESLEIVGGDAMCGQIRASALTTRAACAIERGVLESAVTDLADAYRLLEPQSSMVFAAGVQADLVRWWLATAKLRSAQGQQEQSLASWDEALSLAQQTAALPHVDSVYGAKSVASVLGGYSEALAEAGRAEEARSKLAEAKEILQRVGLPVERFNG